MFFAVTFGALVVPYSFALGQGSTIDILQRSLCALVTVKSEIASASPLMEMVESGGFSGREAGAIAVSSTGYLREGGGVIVDPAGIIVTNAHIVRQAGRIRVVLSDNMELAVIAIAIAPDADLAFLKIAPPGPLESAQLAGSDEIMSGATVYNIGRSEALRGTITEGRIIGLGSKSIVDIKGQLNTSFGSIITDLDVYSGDSGSPIFNGEGHLIGLIRARSESGSACASLAIPATSIRNYLDLLK